MSKVYQKGPAQTQMNMTPLIDVTFQLIIFFMLVNNIISEENIEMVPPELENPKTRELTESQRIVVNIQPLPFDAQERSSSPLNFPGEAVGVHIGSQISVGMDNLGVVTQTLKEAVAASPKDKDGKPLLEVVLRADCALYYDEVQHVLAAITGAGVSTVNLVALMPPDQQ